MPLCQGHHAVSIRAPVRGRQVRRRRRCFLLCFNPRPREGATRLVRQATGPIIETGSGLTTVLMAAATKNTVYCLEHHALHAAQLKQLAAEAGVGNIGLCECRMKGRWYDPNDMDGLPEHFSVGLNDGPPRTVGSRMGFYEYFGGRVDTIIVDDADDAAYADELTIWADSEKSPPHGGAD